MKDNCYDSCEYAKYEYIDSTILERWNQKRSVNEFLNSFCTEEIRGIACNLAHRGDAEFFCSFDSSNLEAAVVLSDYFRAWMVDNLKSGVIDGIGDLCCVLYDIRASQQENGFCCEVA